MTSVAEYQFWVYRIRDHLTITSGLFEPPFYFNNIELGEQCLVLILYFVKLGPIFVSSAFLHLKKQQDCP